MPYHTLLKVIDLFYDCHTTIPANGALAMMAALKSLQVDSVKDFMGPMGPPITAPYPGARPTPVDVQATSQFSRRQTMSYIQPINELKRPRSNMGQTPPPQMIRSFVAPLKVQASTLEPVRLTPFLRLCTKCFSQPSIYWIQTVSGTFACFV